MSRKKIDVLMCAAIAKNSGGIYQNLYFTAQTLEKYGFRCELMLNSYLEDRLPIRINKYLSPYTIALKIIFRLACREKIRFVQIHEPSAYFYCLLRKIFIFLPRCFIRSHGAEELVFETVSRHIAFPKRTRIFQKIRNVIYKTSFKLADLVIVNNRIDKEFVKGRYKAKNVIISSVSVPDSLYEFVRKETNKEDRGRIVVVFNGRWVSLKGVDILKKIIRLVLKQNNSVHFYLIGIHKENEKEVKDIFADLKQNMHIVSQFDRYKELPDYLNKADILLHPSIHESGGQAILEGMVFKAAVICSENCFLIRELATDGQDVIFVAVDDIKGYVDAILRLAGEKNERELIAENGHRLIKRHTWEKATEEYVRYLQSHKR